MDHVAIKTHYERGEECPSPAGCMWCDGGLFGCEVCGAFEGATPDECPGRWMTHEESDAVYAGDLNFRAGEWREECCQVMRPCREPDAYMAEHGYRREGERWVKV